MKEDEIAFANRILSLKTGEPIITLKDKPARILVDSQPPSQSNIYALLDWNTDGSLSTLQLKDITYHFIWNADGTLNSIRKT